MKRRDLLKTIGIGSVTLPALAATSMRASPSVGHSTFVHRSTTVAGGTAAHASVERIHIPGGAPELQAHLFVNAALHHTSKLGADIGVKVTLFYRSGGQLVPLTSPRTHLGSLDAKGIDSQTVRVMVKVPYGAQPPDPGTSFIARAQVFTRLPGNVDVPFGPAA